MTGAPTPKPSRIVVLEDDTHRIDWLTGVLAGTGASLDWCATVAEFRSAIANPSDVALIILDHDLGPHSITSGDANGEDGLTAARWMPDAIGALAPVLVWSLNRGGGEAMRHALASRGFAVRRVPFLAGNLWTIRTIIIGVL